MSNVKIEATVSLEDDKGDKVVARASPTSTFKSLLASDLRGSTSLNAITTLRLATSGGTEYDVVSISTSDWTISNNQAFLTKTFTAGSTYTAGLVRLYYSTTMYFEATVSKQIYAGAQVRVTVTITVSVSHTHTSPGTASFSDVMGNWIVTRFTIGTRRGARINQVDVYSGTTYQFSFLVSAGGSGTTVTYTGSVALANSVTMNRYVFYDNTNVISVVTVTLSSSYTLDPDVSHSWSYTITIN